MLLRIQLHSTGGTTAGFPIADEVVEELGGGRRPKVTATVNGYTWRTSIAAMGGSFWLGCSAANRAAAGIAAGDEVDLTVELDTAPREITVPDDLAAALAAAPDAATAFEALSYSRKRAIVEPIEAAKTAETRQRRIDKAVTGLS